MPATEGKTEDRLKSINRGAGEQPMVFCGVGQNSVDALLIQPFINYNFSHGWYLTTSPIITANWLAASDDRWTVLIGGGAGKIIRLGKLPINDSLQAYCNVVTPHQGDADWQLRGARRRIQLGGKAISTNATLPRGTE